MGRMVHGALPDVVFWILAPPFVLSFLLFIRIS